LKFVFVSKTLRSLWGHLIPTKIAKPDPHTCIHGEHTYYSILYYFIKGGFNRFNYLLREIHIYFWALLGVAGRKWDTCWRGCREYNHLDIAQLNVAQILTW